MTKKSKPPPLIDPQGAVKSGMVWGSGGGYKVGASVRHLLICPRTKNGFLAKIWVEKRYLFSEFVFWSQHSGF